MKYYAIIKGRNVENKIFTSWDECKQCIHGFKGAKYKSFTSRQDAERYLATGTQATLKSEGKYDKGILHAYVDGSYNKDTGMYGSGIAYVFRGVLYDMDSFSEKPTAESNSWQVEGELMACIKVMEECINAGIKDIVIFHDYEGVAAHAIGTWSRNTQLSEVYYSLMQDYMEKINVTFARIDSHTGDIFNELADELAKYQLNIKSTGAVHEYLKNNKITTMTDTVKYTLETLLDIKSQNIVPLK